MYVNMNYYAILREIHSYAGVSNVSVRFERVDKPDEFVPHAKIENGRKEIVLLQPEVAWDEQKVLEWRASFYHEMGHFDPEVADDYQILADKNIDSESFLANALNCFVDYRQEHNKLGEYCGRDKTLSAGQAIGIKKLLERNSKAIPKVIDTTSKAAIMLTALHISTAAREGWQHDVTGLADEIKSMCAPALQAKMNEAMAAGFKERLEEANTTEALYQILMDLLDLMGADKKKIEQESKCKPKPDKGEGAAGSGDGKGKKTESKGGSGGSGGKERKQRQRAGKISWKDLTVHEHDTPEAATYSPMEIDYYGYRSKGGSFPVAEKLDVRDYVNNTGRVLSSTNSRYDKSTESHTVHSGLSNKIRKLLQTKAQTLTVFGKKKGRLATKSIYRAGMKGTGGYKERVFKEKIVQYDLDTAVSVLIDYSGSMGGDKMKHAIISGVMLNEAIAKVGIPLEILGFTENRQVSSISVLKTFSKRIDNEKLRLNMCKAAGNMSENADGEAILYAYSRLLQQKNKRKVLIVLSDGQPASDRGDCMQYTKDVVKQIERNKHVEIYGLGILTSSVKYIYSNHGIINEADDLERALITVIKDHIIR